MKRKSLKELAAAGSPELKLFLDSLLFELVRIPAGSFYLGSPPDEYAHQPNESPVRKIRISKAFYLGRYEITQAQYQAVMGSNPSDFRGESLAQDQVSFTKALEFCRTLSSMTGVRIALPTEAQWEYAARAGNQTPLYSGNTPADLDKIAWYEKNSGGTIHAVGLKQPNAFGLYDMIGNIWELTADFLGSYENIPEQDPVGELNNRGAMRGGWWDSTFEDARAARRLISNSMFGGSGLRISMNTD
jgi:formylglycine-generating enzyme required for sulfatase activity